MTITTINLHEHHIKFVSDRSRKFNLSKFVRDKLDEYIEMLEGIKDGK